MEKFIILVVVLSCAMSTVLTRPPDSKEKKDRTLHDKPLSESDHFDEGDEHNVNYDHEAFLGEEESKTFDQLSPDESKQRLGKLVAKIDKDGDGFVTEQELMDWIKFTQKRYIYDDVDRQWSHHNLGSDGKINWGEYKNSTYGTIDVDSPEAEEFHYKDMIRRDRRRWEKADSDKDDKLSKEEYTNFLHPEESEHMREVIVDETLEDIDKDKDGFISLEEYIGDLYPSEGDVKEEPDWIKTEKEQFIEFRDKNKDGKMDREEVKDWIVPQDYDHVTSESKHLIQEADENKDGKLSKEEIVEKHDLFVGSQATDFGEALARHDEF